MDTKNKGILLFLKNELEFLHIRKNHPNVDRYIFKEIICGRQRIAQISEQLENPNLTVEERTKLESGLRSLSEWTTFFEDKRPIKHGRPTKHRRSTKDGRTKKLVPVLKVREK